MKLNMRSYAILVVAIFFCAPVAKAWGPEGHKIVAQIAEDRLSVNAKRAVRNLIGNDSLADIANWADETRTEETASWHFVDIKVVGDGSQDKFDPDTDCQDGDCVIDKTKEFQKQTSDATVSKDDRIKALKYLVHFVGDVHQPLHCADRPYRTLADDRGGNEIHVHYPNESRILKLHGVWDSTIIKDELLGDDTAEAYGDKLAKLLDEDDMKEKIAEWRKSDTPEEWAMESHRLAVTVAYAGIPVDQPAHVNPKLGGTYVKNATPVVPEQLEKAGVRLADILNGAFP